MLFEGEDGYIIGGAAEAELHFIWELLNSNY